MQLEKRLICEMLARTGCVVEEQKFEAITLWASELTPLEWSGTDFDYYVDRLVRKANYYIPDFLVSFSGMQLFKDSLLVLSYRKKLIETSKFTSASFEAFYSNFIQIKTQIEMDATTNSSYFSKTTITTTYDRRVYSISLDKTSLNNYINQRGLEF